MDGVTAPSLLRFDNALVFTSRSYTTLVRGYRLRQKFVTPYARSRRLGLNASFEPRRSNGNAPSASLRNLAALSRIIGDWIVGWNDIDGIVGRGGQRYVRCDIERRHRLSRCR